MYRNGHSYSKVSVSYRSDLDAVSIASALENGTTVLDSYMIERATITEVKVITLKRNLSKHELEQATAGNFSVYVR